MALGQAFIAGLIKIFANQHGLALRQTIGKQALVMFLPVMIGLLAHNKVYWGAIAALVQPLKKSVLGIGAGHAPNSGPGVYGHGVALYINRFTQGFHF